MFCPPKTAVKHQWNADPQSKNSYRWNKLFQFVDVIELCLWRRALRIAEVVFITGDSVLGIKSNGDLPNTAFLLYSVGSGVTTAGGPREFNFPSIASCMTESTRNNTLQVVRNFAFLSLKNHLEGRVGIPVGYGCGEKVHTHWKSWHFSLFCRLGRDAGLGVCVLKLLLWISQVIHS